MRRLQLVILFPILFFSVAAFSQVPPPPDVPDSLGQVSESVIRRYFDTYNDHNLPAMLALIDSEFVWLNIVGDSVTAEVRGIEAVKKGVEEYFKSLPSARSTIENIDVLGSFVYVRERAQWEGKEGTKSQAAFSVYEVRDEKIRRVWYYPAVR